MKKSLLFLPVFLLLLTGCSKEELDPAIENNSPYDLVDIQWILEEGDGQEIIEMELPDLFFKNEGEEIMPITLTPLKELQGSSQFQFELPENVTINQDSDLPLVSVTPFIELLSDSYGHLVGGTKVPFQKEESFFPFRISIEGTTDLNPNTSMNKQATLFLKKNTATFKARFVQSETGDGFEVKGKWTGIFYHSMESEVFFNELE